MIFEQNIQISTSFDEDYFHLLWSSKNGSYHRVKTLRKVKRTVITAVYTSIEVTLNFCDFVPALFCLKF